MSDDRAIVPDSERLGSERVPRTGGGGERSEPRWAVGIAIVMVLAVAVVAVIAVGAQYAIPFVVLAALGLVFFGVHLSIGRSKTARYGARAQDATADRGDDPVPHIGFDDSTALGSTDQQPTGPYSEPKSTGAR